MEGQRGKEGDEERRESWGGETALEGERSHQFLLPPRRTACHLLCARLHGSLLGGDGAGLTPLSPKVLRIQIHKAFLTSSVMKPGLSEHGMD